MKHNNQNHHNISNNYHKYTQIEFKGRGNFGEVSLVKSETDQKLYIAKRLKINNDQKTKQAILKQIQVMKSLKHQYIIQYHQSFKEDRDIYIIMEYAQKGDLQTYLKKRQENKHPLTQDQVIQWFIQLCLGLKYIHQRMIVHRDLKTDNIFISQSHQLKIGDFGISRVMNGTFDLSKTVIGTPNILSPQIIQKKPYNQLTDIWSLGFILYKMMTFKYPFEGKYFASYILQIEQAKYPPIRGQYSNELKQLVEQLLHKQPQNRPSVQKILDKPFIKKHLGRVLQNSFMKIEVEQKQNTMQNHSGKSVLNKSPIEKKQMRKSLSSISAASLLNSRTPKNDSLKLIEFKQSYPILIQQNKIIKSELQSLKSQKKKFEQKYNNIFESIENDSNLTKQQAVQKIRQQILLYLYP